MNKEKNAMEYLINDTNLNKFNILELKALEKLLDGVATEKDRATLNLKKGGSND